MSVQIAVCGPRNASEADVAEAFELGQLLAESQYVTLCGGGVGVMSAVAAGVRSRQGVVVGIRPDDDPTTASPDLSVRIFTNLGEARNAVLVWSADVVVSVGGSWGTLSEIALAKRRGGVPVICIRGWHLMDVSGIEVEGILHVQSAVAAVSHIADYLAREPGR